MTLNMRRAARGRICYGQSGYGDMLCNGVEGGEDSERTMLPEYGMKMLFKNCHPRYGRKGYIYVLNRDEFVHAMGSQWVAYKEQIPVDIIEINVGEYTQDHCVIVE